MACAVLPGTELPRPSKSGFLALLLRLKRASTVTLHIVLQVCGNYAPTRITSQHDSTITSADIKRLANAPFYLLSIVSNALLYSTDDCYGAAMQRWANRTAWCAGAADWCFSKTKITRRADFSDLAFIALYCCMNAHLKFTRNHHF